jgi:hypothetical protein
MPKVKTQSCPIKARVYEYLQTKGLTYKETYEEFGFPSDKTFCAFLWTDAKTRKDIAARLTATMNRIEAGELE